MLAKAEELNVTLMQVPKGQTFRQLDTWHCDKVR